MIKKGVNNASMLETAFNPLNEWTHNVYATKGSGDKLTLIKIGVAHSNENGDMKLFINPKHATGDVLLFKKG